MGSFDKLRMTGEPMGSFDSATLHSRIREGVGFASRRMTGEKEMQDDKWGAMSGLFFQCIINSALKVHISALLGRNLR
jgi:hypothetical protein